MKSDHPSSGARQLKKPDVNRRKLYEHDIVPWPISAMKIISCCQTSPMVRAKEESIMYEYPHEAQELVLGKLVLWKVSNRWVDMEGIKQLRLIP